MRTLLLSLLSILCIFNLSASNENVAITNLDCVFRVVPDKEGTSIKEIKNSIKIDYTTRRGAGTAVATAFYNDRISIDKATGGQVEYGMAEDEDVFYSDSKLCVMSLPMKKAGDKATARFERTFKDAKFFTRTALAENYDVENYNVSFVVPNKLMAKIKIVDRMMPDDAKRTVTDDGKSTTITYTVRDLKSADPVSRRVPVTLTMPTIYMLGEFSDHNDLYKYLLSLVKSNVDPDSAKVVQLAREITSGCTTDSAKIAAIYDYVHDHIRYIAVEHGIFAHVPDKPSEVLRKRYGDCKGSAALIRAMLRSAGIDGRYVWVGTSSIPTEWTEYPLLCSGNHMIAAAVTGDSILYLDGTATYTPLGEIPTFIRGRQALVEDTERQCIVGTIPEMTPEADSYKIDLKMYVDAQSGLKADYSETFKGRFNSGLLGSLDGINESKRDEALEKYLTSSVNGSRVENASIERSRQYSEVKALVSLPSYLNIIGDEMYINLHPFYSTGALTIDMKNRPEVDAMVGSPFAAEYSTSLAVPEGYVVAELPDDVEISNRWFDATLSNSKDNFDNKVTAHLSVTLKKSRVDAAELAAYMADVRKLNKAVASQVQLKKKD